MPARLAIVACGNGLGHVKRQVRVLEALRGFQPVAATLVCAPWQVAVLRRWEPFTRLAADVVVRPLDLPVVWHPSAAAYGPWLSTWHSALVDLDLAAYDLVWSDNLVEVLAHRDGPVVLGGSFLWPDVLSTAYPDHPDIERYAAFAADLLERRPPMLTSALFAMSAVRRSTRAVEIGLVPTIDRPEPSLPRTACVIATGSSLGAVSARRAVHRVAARLSASGFELLGDDQAIAALTDLDVRPCDFSTAALATAAVVVGRAGMGTISDAAVAGVPLVTVEDDNPEIEHNARVVREQGLGTDVASAMAALDAGRWLPPPVAVDVDGAVASAAAILALLG